MHVTLPTYRTACMQGKAGTAKRVRSGGAVAMEGVEDHGVGADGSAHMAGELVGCPPRRGSSDGREEPVVLIIVRCAALLHLKLVKHSHPL